VEEDSLQTLLGLYELHLVSKYLLQSLHLYHSFSLPKVKDEGGFLPRIILQEVFTHFLFVF
jgi:hypothetical protein